MALSIYLDLPPLEFGVFVVTVVFGFLSLLLLIYAITRLPKRGIADGFPRRVLVVVFLVLTTLSLLTSDTLLTFVLVYTGRKDKSTVEQYMVPVTAMLSKAFLITSISLVLDWRCQQQAKEYAHSRSRQFASTIRIVLPFFIFIMLVCSVARAVIPNIRQLNLKESSTAYDFIYHGFIATFALATIAICGTAIVLWTNRRPSDCSDEVFQFDDRVLTRIIYLICPFLATLALFFIVSDVLTYHKAFLHSINLSAFKLAAAIIEDLLMFSLIFVALNFGYSRNQSLRRDQDLEVPQAHVLSGRTPQFPVYGDEQNDKVMATLVERTAREAQEEADKEWEKELYRMSQPRTSTNFSATGTRTPTSLTSTTLLQPNTTGSDTLTQPTMTGVGAGGSRPPQAPQVAHVVYYNVPEL